VTLFATFLPFFRASDRPIAIAYFLLVTFLPLPLFNVPRLRLRIADCTSFDALFDVLRLGVFRVVAAMRILLNTPGANDVARPRFPHRYLWNFRRSPRFCCQTRDLSTLPPFPD